MHTRLATAALCTLLSFACDDGEDPKDSGLSPQDSDTPRTPRTPRTAEISIPAPPRPCARTPSTTAPP